MNQKANKKIIIFPKGSVAVFALILMFILAMATIGIITTAVIERKSSISTGNSTSAFQVAESGMERTLQFFKSNFDKTLNDINGAGNCSGGSVNYSASNAVRFRDNAGANIADCSELISKVKKIKSIGTTDQETRAIEEDVFLAATKLLLHFNGMNSDDEFEDSSYYYEKNKPIDTHDGVSDAADIDPVEFVGVASAEFNGIDGYLSIPESDDWDFGDGDFTIDWWEYRTSNLNGKATFQRQNTDVAGFNPFVAGYSNGNNLYFYASTNGSSWDFANAKLLGSIDVNDWTHFAIVRKGEDFYTFKNGEQQDTWSSNESFPDVDAPLEIGRYADNRYFPGYIDEFRISKGVARWTTDFTPADEEYAAD